MEALLDELVRRHGNELRVGLPLGLGKPCRLVNAIYRRARENANLRLEIYTALSLERPGVPSGLAGRLAGPVIERLYDGYPGLDHQRDLRAGRLPTNVAVHEFFFTPARMLDCPSAQRAYLASNYTHVARDMMDRGANVIMQLVARGDEDRYSLSCNPDVTLDLVAMMRDAGLPLSVVGQVHRDLPFMEGDAAVDASYFDMLLDEPETFTLFATPRDPVNAVDHRIGLNASALVRDGGTLQVGIGALGDAVAHALVLRQRDNAAYAGRLREWGVLEKIGEAVESIGGTGTFDKGLYGCSEMLVDGFLHLIDAGVVKRPADDDTDVILHGGFYLGPPDFYRRLRDLGPELRRRIHMTSVGRINQLYGDEDRRRRQRKDARFINSCLKVTLLGSVISDALEDHRVLSGVGGQYNFVAMAHALDDGRSVILARSTRGHGRALESNIVWDYGTLTIPRHLRDVVVTEYGIADLRGASDGECIRAMLCIADSRFQERLRRDAVAGGKLDPDWRIPSAFRDNTRERLEREMSAPEARALFPDYPFGSELTGVERELAGALRSLDRRMQASRWRHLPLAAALLSGGDEKRWREHLARMGLERPGSLRERLERRVLLGALHRSTADIARKRAPTS